MLPCKGELAQRQHIIRARRTEEVATAKDFFRDPPPKKFPCPSSSRAPALHLPPPRSSWLRGLLQFIPHTRNKNGERPWHGFPSTGLLGLPWQPVAPESQGCWVFPCWLHFLAPFRQRQKWHQLCPEGAKRRAALPRGRSFGSRGQVKSHSFARGSLSFQPQVCKACPQDPEEEPSEGVPCGWPHEQLRCQAGSAPCQQSLSPAPARRRETTEGGSTKTRRKKWAQLDGKRKKSSGFKLSGRFHHISKRVP